jgi:hypothetical protein
MPFLVSEELQTEDALSGFRGATDPPSVTPLKPERRSSISNSSESIKGILHL